MNVQKNPRILVVDSDPSPAERISRLLAKRFDAEVEVRGNLREAREVLAAETFDIVALGYIFTDGTGLELLSEINSKEDHPHVIMVTGHGNEEVASWAVRDGAFGYVLKNEELEGRLADAVQRALGQRQFARVQNALAESEAFYRSLFDDSDEALFIETLEGDIEDANRAACALLGYEPGELNGRAATELLPPDKLRDFEDVQGALLAGEWVEFENQHRDGHRIPVVVGAREVMTRRGPRYIITVKDLSDEKRAAMSLEREKAFTMTVLDTMSEIFVLIDPDGSYLRWNNGLNEVTGYTDEEIRHKKPSEFHSPEGYSRLQSAIERVFATGEPQRAETSVICKDGTTVPYELSGALLRDESGKPVAIAGLGRDISDRKRTELALRNMVTETNERREEITALLESTRLVMEHKEFVETATDIFRLCKKLIGAPVGYVALFADDEILIFDPESQREQFLPLPYRQIREAYVKEFVAGRAVIENSFDSSEFAQAQAEDKSPVRSMLVAPLLAEGVAAGVMALFNKPAGFTKRDSLMASAFGEIASVALQTSLNLTMLKDSEERFRSVAETANEAIVCADSDLRITFWNPGAQVMFGYRADEVLNKKLTLMLPERLREARMQSLMRVASEGSRGAGRTYEMTGLRKDGTEFAMELSRSTPWVVGDDLCITAIIRDISVRKEAEEALQRSEAAYRAIVEDQAELISRYNVDGTVTFVNDVCARYFGTTREEMQSGSFMPRIPEEDRQLVAEQLATLSREQPVVTVEHRVINGDGEIRWQQWTNRAIFDGENGNIAEIQGVGRDITDRKAVEDALRDSEGRLRQLFDTAPDVIYSISPEGELTSLNQSFETLTGFTREEWMGKPFAPLIHPDDVMKAIETFETAKSGGYPAPYELRIMTRTGEYATAEFISAPLLRNGEVVGEFGIARDVRERKLAQQALAESEELYRGLLATSPDAVVVTDLDFKVTMVSDKAVEHMGASGASELIGADALEVLLPESRERAAAQALSTIETGFMGPVDFLLRRRDGTSYTGEFMVSLLRDPEGNPTAFMVTIRDITERKRAEHELQVLNNELEGYAHMVSHDLKGPLASIGVASGTIQSLLKGEMEEDTISGVVEMASIIETNVEKSNQLIDDLLELAEAAQKPRDAVDVDIAAVVSGILAERRGEIKSKHVKVRTDGNLGRVTASPTHMYQLFSNLLDNAIKHNDSRKPQIAVEYAGRDDDGGHEYAVRDNGSGIGEDEAANIFLPFVSGAAGKSGIGLATVEKIVGVYGGTITFRNDAGACFEFVIYDVT